MANKENRTDFKKNDSPRQHKPKKNFMSGKPIGIADPEYARINTLS
jgi:hypothetical protein